MTERELRAELLPDLTDEGSFCAALNVLSDDQAVAAFIQILSFRPEVEIVPADERRFVEIAREECEDMLAVPSPTRRLAVAAALELDPAPDLPGQYINLPEIYQDERGLASYAGGDVPNTGPHVMVDVDYSDQGLPPAGGPHWGSGACTTDPTASPRFCGPAPRGIYRDPWPAATLVHNMEHGGTIIWYNTSNQEVIDDLEEFVGRNSDKLLVLTPYPEMEAEHVAITIWTRRDLIPVSEYSQARIEAFMDAWYCKWDPEGFC